MSIVGIRTAFFAATAARVQFDVKKVIAYSTCSQLGYMLFAAGRQQYPSSFFHLFNHAFFKALLFRAAGSVIHALINEQDARRTGGLGDLRIFVFMASSIGTMARAGSTFLAGFYSKDIIRETSISSYTVNGLVRYWLGTRTAVFTGIYSSDVRDDRFAEETTTSRETRSTIHSSSALEIGVLGFLAIRSVRSGYLCRDLFVGLGADFFSNSLAVTEQNGWASAEFLPVTRKRLPTIRSVRVSFEVDRREEVAFDFISTRHFRSHK